MLKYAFSFRLGTETSRTRHAGAFHSIDVDILTEDEAAEFLLSGDCAGKGTHTEAKALARELGCLFIGLSHARDFTGERLYRKDNSTIGEVKGSWWREYLKHARTVEAIS